jgi:hypothetical protein
MLKGLVIGGQDIRWPVHGSSRLALVVLHALSLNHHKILYLIPGSSREYEVTRVTMKSRFGESRVVMMKTGMLKNPLSLLHVTRMLGDDHDYILCLDRRSIPLCKVLSTRLDAPLVTYMDSPKYLHLERLTKIREKLLRPVALAWYVIIGLLSDVTITVSKYIEDYLGKWGVRSVTIEPSYALLHERDDLVKSNDDYKIDELNYNAILCSCPLDLTLLVALKNPEVPIVVTGLQAYYIGEYLRIRGLTSKFKSLHLLHNISDRALEKLHDKVIISLISRPRLTGISMALIQELYFGKPIITDTNTASRIRGLMKSKTIIVNDRYVKWPSIVKELIKRADLNELGVRARQFFDNKLSPRRFATYFEHALHNILSK